MSRERELLQKLRVLLAQMPPALFPITNDDYYAIFKSIDAILAQPEAESAQDFAQKLADAQKPMPPEFQKVLNDNFWELVTEKPAPAAGETPETDGNLIPIFDAWARQQANKIFTGTVCSVSAPFYFLLWSEGYRCATRQRNELRAENERLSAHALAIEESVKRIKKKAAAEHKDHPFCPHCSPCRHGEKLAALTGENERLRKGSGPLPCCGDWENCDNRCIPLAWHWKNTAQRLRKELDEYKLEEEERLANGVDPS